jgi:hypothetical protein
MTIPFEIKESFLGISAQAVLNHLHRPILARAIDRTTYLPEALELISKMIADRFTHCVPVTYECLIDALVDRFGSGLGLGTLHHICRTFPGLMAILGLSMDTQRVAVDEEAITAFHDELQ